MFTTTEAIVLQLYPYKDKNAVVKLYSAQLGLTTCWVNSVHGKKSRTKAAFLQPFSIINAEISHKENSNLSQLKEIGLAALTQHIRGSIDKGAIALFLSELLMRCLKEASPDPPLYLFLRESILLLDGTNEKCNNFHLIFLIRLCDQLGFLPSTGYHANTPFFNLEESIYQKTIPCHPHFLDSDTSRLLSELSAVPMHQFHQPQIPLQVRRKLVKNLLEYFTIHTGMSPLKSHLVLEEL